MEATTGYYVSGCGGPSRGQQVPCDPGTFQPHKQYVTYCTPCNSTLCPEGQRIFLSSAQGRCTSTSAGECLPCHRRYLTASVAPDDPRASCCFDDVATTKDKAYCQVEDHPGLLEYDCQAEQPVISSCSIGCPTLPNATCDGPGGTCVDGSRAMVVRFEADHVPSGEQCQPVQVVKVCTGHSKFVPETGQGDWSAEWSPAGKFERCNEACIAQNGTALPPGRVEERTGYASSAAPLGKTCIDIARTERRTCPLSGSVDAADWHAAWAPSGEPQCHEACPSIARIHGETVDRVRFRERYVPPAQSCESEVQRSTCHDGVTSAWSGYGFGEAECSVLCASACLPTMLGDGEWDDACVNAACCLDNGDAYSVLLGRLRAGEYSALRGEPGTALEHLGWGCNQSTRGASLLAPSLRDLSEQACRLSTRLQGGFDFFANEELRIPTLGFRKNEAAIEDLLSLLKRVEDDLQQVHGDQLVLRQWIWREQIDSTLRGELANVTRSIVRRMDERFDKVDAGLSTLEDALADVRGTLVSLDAELGGISLEVQRTQSLVLRNGVQLLANGRLIGATTTRVLGAIDSVGIDLVSEIRRGNAVVVAEVHGELRQVVGGAVRTIAAGQKRLANGQQMLREGQAKLAEGIEGVARLVVEVGEEVKEVVRVECGMNRELLYDVRESQLAVAAKNAEEELIANIESVLKQKMEQIDRCDHQISGDRWDGDLDGILSLRELVTLLGDFGAVDPAGTAIFGEFAALGWSTALEDLQLDAVQRASSVLYGTFSTAEEMREHSDLLRCSTSVSGCLAVAQSWDINGDASLSLSDMVDVLVVFRLMNDAARTIWDGIRPSFDNGKVLPLSLGYAIINALQPMNSMLDHLIEEAFTLLKVVPGLMEKLGGTAFSIIKAAATCTGAVFLPFLAPMCGQSALDALFKAAQNGGVILEYGKKIWRLYNSCKDGPCKGAFVNLIWEAAVSSRCSIVTGISGLVGEFAQTDRFEVTTADGRKQRTAAGNSLLLLAGEAHARRGEDSGACDGSGGRRRAQAIVTPLDFDWQLVTFSEVGDFLWDLEGTVTSAKATVHWANNTGGNLSALPSDLFVIPPERAREYEELARARLGSLSGDPDAVSDAFAWSAMLHDTLTTSSNLVGRAEASARRESSVRHVAGSDTSVVSCAASQLSVGWSGSPLDANPTTGLARLGQQEQALVEQQQSIVTTLLREAYTYARQIEYFTLVQSTLLRPVVEPGFNHQRVPNVPGIPNALDALGTRFSDAFGGEDGFLLRARETIRAAAAAKVSTQVGWVRHTLSWESASSAFEQLRSTGQISLNLRPDLDSQYFDVRVLRAVAFVLPALGEGNLRVELRKGSDSTFLDAESAPWAFLHEWASISHSDSFNPSTCIRNYASIENQFHLARDNVASSFGTNVNYPSPFGSWTLEVDESWRSSAATSILLEFYVTYRTGGGTSPYLFESINGIGDQGPTSTLDPVLCLQTIPPTAPPPPSPPCPPPSPPSPLRPPSVPHHPRPSPPQVVPIAPAAPIFVVIVTMTAAGELSDFSDDRLREVAVVIADAAGVRPTDVEVTASAASVLLRAEVIVSKATRALAAAALSDRLSSPAAATSFFGAVSGGGVDIISIPLVELATQSPTANSPPPPAIAETPVTVKAETGNPNGIMFAAIGVGACIIVLAMYGGYRWKKRRANVVLGRRPATSTTAVVHLQTKEHANDTKVYEASVL